MTSNPQGRVRAVAAEIVDAVSSHGKSLDVAIAAEEERVAAGDRALLRMLCYGSLRHYWQLQEWIGLLVERPLRKRDGVINALLAIGLYQLVLMRIPDHAVVSETVAAVRCLRRPKLAGLVNACLRRFVRENLSTVSPKSDESRWNHPAWLIRRLQQDWKDDWQEILAANMERAPMWLRVNRACTTAEQYQQGLLKIGVEARPLDAVPGALELAEPRAVQDLPGFSDGQVSVQDAAAQLAAHWLLAAAPGRRVLDACAAPGGKSGHLLEAGGDALSLVCVDNDEQRCAAIAENLARLGKHATIITADASKPEAWWDKNAFDAILLDAPCSASGVIRRHPDIKLLRRAGDITRLAAIQQGLLAALWPLLAPGGTLLYATCSVISAENDEVTGKFLADHEDAIENDVLPNNNIRDLMHRKACGYQILPGTAGMDGFYYAALKKKKVS